MIPHPLEAVTTFVVLLLLPLTMAAVHSGRNAAQPAPPRAAGQCDGRPNGVFMPNPKGCHFFIYCHNGQALEANCPGSLWFNLNSGICDKRENVACTLNVPPPQVPIVTDEPIDCPTRDSAELTFLPSRVDCGRFYICYHGRPRRQQCISDMHWNGAVNRCDHPRNAKCPIKRNFPVCPRRGLQFYPHPEECDYFIYCLNGLSSVQQCPFYHHWDVETNSCRWRNLARCAI